MFNSILLHFFLNTCVSVASSGIDFTAVTNSWADNAWGPLLPINTGPKNQEKKCLKQNTLK